MGERAQSVSICGATHGLARGRTEVRVIVLKVKGSQNLAELEEVIEMGRTYDACARLSEGSRDSGWRRLAGSMRGASISSPSPSLKPSQTPSSAPSGSTAGS
jgi:hypothetical protein